MEHPEAAFCLASSFFISYIQSCKMQPRHRGYSRMLTGDRKGQHPVAQCCTCFIMFHHVSVFCFFLLHKEVQTGHVMSCLYNYSIMMNHNIFGSSSLLCYIALIKSLSSQSLFRLDPDSSVEFDPQ